MKNLVLVLVDMEKTIELVGVFSTTRDAVQHIWNDRVGKKFTAYPIGKDGCGEHETHPIMRENLAMLQLREEPSPAFAGLGPMKYFGVWAQQQDVEGHLCTTIACFTAADHVDRPLGDLRWAKLEGVLTYTHIDSALGQSIEAVHTERLAHKVQAKMLESTISIDTETIDPNAPTYCASDAALMQDIYDRLEAIPEEERRARQRRASLPDEFLCEACEVAPMPGAIFPFAPGGMDDHAYVQACDVCDIFPDDMRAAKAVSVVIGKPVKLSEDKLPYIDELTYEEARMLERSMQRPPRVAQS